MSLNNSRKPSPMPKTDTPTPLTDEEAQNDFLVCPESGEIYVNSDFARTLERQLAESQQREQGLREALVLSAFQIGAKGSGECSVCFSILESDGIKGHAESCFVGQALSTPRGEAMVPWSLVERYIHLVTPNIHHSARAEAYEKVLAELNAYAPRKEGKEG